MPGRAARTRRRPSAPSGPHLVVNTKPLTGIPAIRNFFRTTQTPVYFVSATAFNLLGIDRWVRTFTFINYFDSFDGWHPNVFVPREQSPRAFGSIEEIVNYLLGHKEVADLVSAHGPGKAAFLMFDDETEQLADELRLDVVFPPASLRHRLDSKIETTRLGDEAGVPSVPNTMGTATTYPELISLARSGGLGDDLVVQTPYGDSGQTTFFIADGRDWDRHERKVVGEQLKVMKRIEPRELAIEGVITRHGTLVVPSWPSSSASRSSHPTTVAGAATTSRRISSPRSSVVTPANGRSRWANGCDGRAIEGTSSLTSSWTRERGSSGSVS